MRVSKANQRVECPFGGGRGRTGGSKGFLTPLIPRYASLVTSFSSWALSPSREVLGVVVSVD